EIEFYAQTQQLILGGKNKALRAPATLGALAALAAGDIASAAREELTAAYRYLRRVEHRLQMINDEQTHAIPKSDDDVRRLAAFLEEPSADAFRRRLVETLETVKRHFDDLFEDDAAPPAPGPLVFTGVNDDPATIETLTELGFSRPSEVSAFIRRWHAGGMRSTRTERARNLLTKLMAPLLQALSAAGNPDDAFFAFDDFLKRLPAGVQVFSLLLNNQTLFDTLIRIMTISPYLGRELSKRVNIIEMLLTNAWTTTSGLDVYKPSLAQALGDAAHYEDVLNAVRRWAGEQKFLISAQLAVDALSPDDAAAHFSAIADVCIEQLVAASSAEMRRQHGKIDGRLVVVGLGRLGAGEMTAASDVDLIFIYDAPPGAQSDGERPLSAIEYYTRLVRRIVTAMSAATEEGGLYSVDMQLRPSGGAGPTAVSFAAFRRYYEDEAWTWEIMALTKARVIAGEASLAEQARTEIAAILRRPRDAAAVFADAREMRARLLAAKPARSPWDVKLCEGGLTDIGFICQAAALTIAAQAGAPPRSNAEVLAWLARRGALDGADADALAAARALFDGVFQLGRVATGGVFDPEQAGAALKARMASACGAATIEEAAKKLTGRQAEVANIYHKMLGETGPGNQDAHDRDT
ncbi:MAG: [protein-PII] uridylyltransferase family protein, partial [Hyphococcus sp.]